MSGRQLLGWGLIGTGVAVMIAAVAVLFAPGLGGARWLWLIGLLLTGEALCVIGVATLGPEVVRRLKSMLAAPKAGKSDDGQDR